MLLLHGKFYNDIMNKPIISVIVPFYNEEKYIAKCLYSLLRQSYSPLEIIAVNDGSTDRSAEIVSAFQEVFLFQQPHLGPGIARNFGATHAQGEILVFADADMTYDVQYVSLLVAPILAGKAFGTTHIDERVANSDNIWAQGWSINAGHVEGKRTPKNLPQQLNIFRALPKKDFLRVGGFDHHKGYFDDSTLSEKLNKKADVVNEPIAYHHNPASMQEVFYSARWIGKSPGIKISIQNIFRYSLANSLRNALKKIIQGAPLSYILFKLVYDTGMLCGILQRKNHSK